MKEEKKRIAFKILLKILLAVPLTVIFILIRCVQFFLKLCGPVVSFVCILSSVVVSLGVLIEIILQIQGKRAGNRTCFSDNGPCRRSGLCTGGRRRHGYGGFGGGVQLDMEVLHGKFGQPEGFLQAS